MYRRTGLKGHLLISIGAIVTIIGEVESFINARIGNERLIDTTADVLFMCGTVLVIGGTILIYTIEGGAAKDAYSGHSVLDIVLGNVSTLEKEKKKYPPRMSRGGGMIGGSIVIVYGILKCLDAYPKMSSLGISVIIFGVALFIISLVFLKPKDREKEQTEKNKK
jgi:hypothetical protein